MTTRAKGFAGIQVLGGYAAVVALAVAASAQELTKPVYRVAADTPAKQVAATATATGVSTAGDDFFNLEQRGGEHPLAPSLRLAERVLAEIENNKPDYTCMFIKRERIDGALTEPSYIQMTALNDPFCIHMRFVKPKKGQECLYAEGQHGGKMLARGHGVRKWAGVLQLDPHGDMAMDGNRHPITKAGLHNLTKEIIEIAQNDMKYGECTVKTYPNVKVDGRPTVMIEVVHPTPRREFKFHIARIFVDREHRVPVRFAAWTWPTEEGGQPVLEEEYTYTDLKFNHGYTAADFVQSNPNFFK